MGDIELKNKRVLVVGGNGYLGSFLVKKLKEKAAHVFILSRNCKNLKPNSLPISPILRIPKESFNK